MRKTRSTRLIRWGLSVLLVAVGVTVTWAWGQVANLAPPPPSALEAPPPVVYAAWQPAGADGVLLFRSTDEGATWQPLDLPGQRIPTVWAGDTDDRLAVATSDGSLLISPDRGDSWTLAQVDLPILSLAWDGVGHLYVGSDGQGVHRLEGDGTLTPLAAKQADLGSAPVVALVWIETLPAGEGRLFAATPNALFSSDDGGTHWAGPQAGPGWITALEASDQRTVYVGTATGGVYRSVDGGETWQPAREGLGLAAGQMVAITALEADPQEQDVLYAAVDHLLGSSQVHTSAAGTYASLDSGTSWQPLAGPAFPEAQHASALVVVPGKPLYALAVTSEGLQSYAPDVDGAMAALESPDAQARVGAARMLGLAQAPGAGETLLAVLDDPDPAVILAAADALGRVDDPATVSSLLVALEHPRQEVRLGAARALGAIGADAAVEPLRVMLFQGEGLEVSVAAEALGRIGSPAAVEGLISAVADPIPSPQWHAALEALETMGEPAVGPLVEMLGSRDVYERRNAAQALGWLAAPSATRALAGALEDGDPKVRQQAAWALGEIGDPAAQAALDRARTDDPVAEVQAEAGRAMARLAEQATPVTRWPATWAPVLNRLQAMRWLVLALSLAGAAWLAMGTPSWAHLSLRQRTQ
jgi:HEAT repeat protein